MKSAIRVSSPPPRPLVIYDGDCNFCTFWIRRWQLRTVDAVDYAPLQDPRIAAQFPELSRDALESAVQLVEPEGSIFSGAEAVFRLLAKNPRGQRPAGWYARSPLFARVSEWSYGLVARNRTVFSALTRLAWGKRVEPPTYRLTRGIFLRALAIIYLIAFVSLGTQIIGLVGADGILPAKQTIASVTRGCDTSQIGWDRYHLFPTLCWFDTSDAFLKLQCAAGVALAILVIIGFAPAPCLFLLWLIYLSLTTIGRDFMGFQWDNLLLETGLLAAFFAPLQLLPHHPAREATPSRIVRWLLCWVLFRLMFESGCVKLVSGDETWRRLTALTYHYQTQPLPTWIGWYAQQLPAWFQKLSCLVLFAIELAVPFFIFAPRRLRQWAAWLLIALQVLILLTGNYTFFNGLTIALCLLLFDDAAFEKLIPQKWKVSPSLNLQPRLGVGGQPSTLNPDSESVDNRPRRWPRAIIVPVACVTIAITTWDLLGTLRLPVTWPAPVVAVVEWLAPFRSYNGYGLFAVMTTERREIIIEGSNDGVNWSAYGFKYKPGDVTRRPAFVAPHQPRLDWQMWFAALGNYQQNPWLVSFCVRLLQGSPDVQALLEKNPFPDQPPRFIRAQICDYRFTDLAARRNSGAWWQRGSPGEYLPAFSLADVPQ